MVALRRQPDQTAAVASLGDLFLAEVADDTEEAPWMVMGDPQFWSATAFAQSLQYYARRTAQPWYVAGMLPILFTRPGRRRKGQVAPDTMVAFVADHARDSYDLEAEGRPPAFVLEVISSSSVVRDLGDKRALYELLGVSEYALFLPPPSATPLRGFRLGAEGLYESWPLDDQGRLWSEALGLYLVVRGAYLQAMTPDGQVLRTLEQAEVARQQAEVARQQAEVARQQAEAARQQAEVARQQAEVARQQAEERDRATAVENARLRAELERLRHP